MPGLLSLNTPASELYKFKIARLGETMSRKLAVALAGFFRKKSADEATVEDLLHYLPARYEDRSNMATIRDLDNGLEASLELYVKVAGGYQVRNKRSFGRGRLFIFEVTATDPGKTGR